MEISRQRRRSGVLEGTTHVCEHCQGTGRVRSTESAALAALRAVELEALQGGGEVTLKVVSAECRLITGMDASTDVIEASARAYVNAINRSLLMQQTTPGIEMPVV
jgi:Ribonuclease G/E